MDKEIEQLDELIYCLRNELIRIWGYSVKDPFILAQLDDAVKQRPGRFIAKALLKRKAKINDFINLP